MNPSNITCIYFKITIFYNNIRYILFKIKNRNSSYSLSKSARCKS